MSASLPQLSLIKYKIIRLVNSYLNREIDRREFKVRMCAYYGWLKHADAKNLLYKKENVKSKT